MAHMDAAAVWNPAFRSNDDIPPVTTPTNDLEIDTAIEATTIPLGSPMETPHDVSFGDVLSPTTDYTNGTQEATASDVGGPGPSTSDDQEPTQDILVAGSHVHDTQEELVTADGKVIEPTEESVGENGDATMNIHSNPGGEHVADAQPTKTGEEETQVPEGNINETVESGNITPTGPTGAYRGDELPSTNGGIQSSHDIWGSPAQEEPDEDDFFNQLKTQTKPIYFSPETETRFEEGVPLLNRGIDSLIGPPQTVESRIDNVLKDDENDEDGVFKSVPDTTSQPSPESHITRKSTFQVLDSLGLSQDSTVNAVDPSEQGFESVFTAADPQESSSQAPDPNEQELESELAAPGSQEFAANADDLSEQEFEHILSATGPEKSGNAADRSHQEFESALAAAGPLEVSTNPVDQSKQELQGAVATAKSQFPVDAVDPSEKEFESIFAAAGSQDNIIRSSSDDDLAARWQAELSESDEPAKGLPSEDELAARWQAELDDDDDDLLFGDESAGGSKQPSFQQLLGNPAPSAQPSLSSPFGTPENSGRPRVQQSSYVPHQPSTSDLLEGIPATSIGYFAQQQRPTAGTKKAESFAERAKEGYRSPYDLPDDLTRPRRPVVANRAVVTQPGVPPPPPRSNSLPVPPPKASSSTPSMPTPGTASTTTAPAAKNFFEELPLPPPRAPSRPASTGRYAPAPIAGPAAPSYSAPPPPVNPYAGAPPLSQPSADFPPQSQLEQPQRIDPYANLLTPSASSGTSAPLAASRYSPKPPNLQDGVKPPASPKYSPAPPPAGAPPPARNRYASQAPSNPGQTVTLPFQPRTSSPLAYHEKVSYRPQQGLEKRSSLDHTAFPPAISVQSQPDPALNPLFTPGETAIEATITGLDVSEEKANMQSTSPPRNQYAPAEYVNEFTQRINPAVQDNVPPISTPAVDEPPFIPPRRSMTQSPGQQTLGPRLSVPSVDPLQRPASVHGSGSPTRAVNPYAPAQTSLHNRVPSQQLEFIPPVDDQQYDPLERWKGAPIVKFGFGGTVLSCFPKHIPRYTAGQVAPRIKPSPGEVKTCQLNDWIPPSESIVRHPGPLKSKSKKKDLLAWLSSKIAAFENEGMPESARLLPDGHKRYDEKVLLWKVVRIMVEHDGALEGSSELQKSLRSIIIPYLHINEADESYETGFRPVNAARPIDAPSRPDASDSQAIESLRNNLLIGEREKAVWGAVDSRLWGHAMLLASTMDRSVWKQVIQEFVRREVRSTSGTTEPLAALYEIFAGNVEESVDELVPPSARAGLQMISKVDGHGSSRNALEGLESWRETLGLVLSNRSADDHQALLALGRLLLNYGRTEAAHICFIFSRAAVFGGVDDPKTSIVLLGVDHQRSSTSALRDEDCILLTEAYDFANSVLSASPKPPLPHLLAYKLTYAWSLADRGRKAEAQQYCDAIAATVKATTKSSPYHNQHLYYGVDELSARLKQSASDGGSSWISKPSMEKVSGSMWAKFNSFVAGEDSDAASTDPAKGGEAEIGPFAKISGTPTVSRSPSMSDIYGVQPSHGTVPSRYLPNNQHAPTSSPEQFRGRSSLDSQRSSSYGFGLTQRRESQEPSTPVDNGPYQAGMFYNSPPSTAGYQHTPPQSSYIPLAPVEEDLVSQPQTKASFAPGPGSPSTVSPYQPPGYGSFGQPLHETPSVVSNADEGGYMPPVGGGGYEPPADSNIASESEMPEEQNNEEPVKKKSFMDDDDDDDIAARAAAIQKAEKARKDREADEAFRKAAEADAKRAAPAKKGWFGGWFGGKKEGENAGGGPIRAKLGEESSFYYDTELKKWVNKKDPNSATAARATPPPPRGSAPPSRTASGSSGAPPPPASSASPMLSGAGSRPSSATGANPPPLTGSPAPPSALGVAPPIPRSISTGAAVPTPPSAGLTAPPRPATSLSNASSIDDLLGAPQARKGPAAKGKKKGRYVDVMAK
ncbi:COPII coat assembly protein SEC16 [Aspergillus homomorphus CBS 101889]|uniref:Protein transport protein sec16 n=1 Tax=Aspergillus homomorphus (strain CBS 101889) TaxID=1450537 RepID=A0A395HK85_ASPHC|nr:hypothetical protein BO97DRAFT_446239 [Aspergillus homomorphus CBS 101889]RAL08342.1 hypothetical protein BO97DRAFT_446239 [Aspergillus homomorphus CBS 101889]